jgi:hypothetical protein
MTTSGNDFEIAKAVADQLKDIEKERQQRILRWVAESLGLDFGIATTAERSVGGTASVAIATPSQANPDLHRQQFGRVDIKSFVDSKKPKSDVQFAAVVAYYYRFEAPVETQKTLSTRTFFGRRQGWRVGAGHRSLWPR